MKKITIKEVAKEAGVSVGSVHLAMTGKPGITENKRNLILEVAKNIGYKPNMLASNLKRESRSIAVVLPKKDEHSIYYYDYMWKAVDDFLPIAKDYNLNVISYEYSDLEKTLDEIDLNLINGLITVGYPEGNYKKAITRVSDAKIPIVLIDSDFVDVNRICCIKPNTHLIGRLTGELLLNFIHRLDGKILICGGDESYPNHLEIVESLKEFFEEAQVGNRVLVEYFWQIDDAIKLRLETILKENPIIGCCSVNSRSTVAIAETIKNCGLSGRVPVIGNGVFYQSIENLKEGNITALINKRPYEQAEKALETMSDLLVKTITPDEVVVDVGVDVVFKSLISQYEKKILKR